MARQQFLRLIVFGVLSTGSLAQDAATPRPLPSVTPAPSPGSQWPDKKNRPGGIAFMRPGNQGDFAQKLYDRLSPEEKQQYQENFERWKALPQEERQALLMSERNRKEKMAQNIQDALKNTGLQLDKDHQEVFNLRYTQERRKIEEQLRKEMEEKRRPLIKEMLERLKKEFEAVQTTSSSPSPSPTPAPTPVENQPGSLEHFK